MASQALFERRDLLMLTTMLIAAVALATPLCERGRSTSLFGEKYHGGENDYRTGVLDFDLKFR